MYDCVLFRLILWIPVNWIQNWLIDCLFLVAFFYIKIEPCLLYRPLMKLSPSWTHWERSPTRTVHWSCNSWETIWHCGHLISMLVIFAYLPECSKVCLIIRFYCNSLFVPGEQDEGIEDVKDAPKRESTDEKWSLLAWCSDDRWRLRWWDGFRKMPWVILFVVCETFDLSPFVLIFMFCYRAGDM